MQLNKILQSPIQLKIVSFFHKHSSTVDTARGVATWVNHDLKDVEKALEKLVAVNILIVHRTNYATAYSYTQNKNTTSKIEKLIKSR